MSGMVSKATSYIINLGGMPLYTGVICGGICVLIDIDHPLALAIGIEDGRFLHPYYFAIAVGIIFGCCTYVGGLLIKAVLRKGYA
jgi:hypothetical protein